MGFTIGEVVVGEAELFGDDCGVIFESAFDGVDGDDVGTSLALKMAAVKDDARRTRPPWCSM